MFGKILVANRGEIACRIMRTCHRLGIATVAVYSDADKNAPHVEMAGEAVRIGPPEAAKSYLDMDAIIAACRETGAEAVHPGYGFLSERAAFPEALAAAGIAWIGPNPAAIEAMGDKIESKRRAKAAGVSTVPGGEGALESAAEAADIADAIGYPVMIKASAGGGGKGMRIALTRDEVQEGFDRARSEAASSFGDERVFVEKFIVEPRHIEIQVLGDKHGNVIHLGERECSIQRRNQKVIEEAPSPLLTPELREKMGAEAVALAKAVGYDSAGTVEFVASQNADFYFLEMNTRLQVEHPVTELVFGVDLVEEMIRVAAGEPLRIAASPEPNGWAIEARLYAEDADRGFLPSTGRIRRLAMPPASSGPATVRVDTGVVEGSDISRFYDPMIAKIITHAPTRAEATEAMAVALDRVVVDGIRHNALFLAALMDHPRWSSGHLSTDLIAKEFADSARRPMTEAVRIKMAAVAMADAAREAARREDFGPHASPVPGALSALFDDGERIDGEVTDRGAHIEVRIGKGSLDVIPHPAQARGVWSGRIGGDEVVMGLDRAPHALTLTHRGVGATVMVRRPVVADLTAWMPETSAAGGDAKVICPMPGLVVSLSVSQGENVELGQALAVIEAMKMENIIRAERAGTIKSVHVSAGDSLAVDAVILEFE